jgi:hypothetical protein
MAGRLQEMVQGDDSVDYNMCFALSLGKREAECVRVFYLKVQAKSTLNCKFYQRIGITGFQILTFLSVHENTFFKHHHLLIFINLHSLLLFLTLSSSY